MARIPVRRLLWIAVGLLALPLLLLGAASALIPREQLAREIAQRVAAQTGADVQPGKVSLKVLGGLGLSLGSGTIRGSGAELARRTGTGKDIGTYEVAYSRLDVTVGLGSLLKRQATAKSVHVAGPALQVEVAGDPVRFKNYDILLADLHLDLTESPAGADTATAMSIPADLRFTVGAEATEVVQRGIPWQDVRMQGIWQERRLQVTMLTGRLEHGHVAATGTLDYNRDPGGVLAWQARLTDLPASQLLTPYLPDLGEKLDCGLSGELSGRMAVKDAPTRRRSLTMSGRLSAGEGVLRAAAWLQDVSPYLGRRQDLKTVRFSSLEHEFEVAEGRYLIKTLSIDGHDTDWQAEGWLDFTGEIGLAVGVRLPADFTPDLGGMSFLAETMRDADRRVNLGLKLTGLTAAPTVGLDLSRLGRGH